MTGPSKVFERHRTLVKNFRLDRDASAHRNEFKNAVAEALREDVLSQPAASLLLEAWSGLEAWSRTPPPAFGEAFTQWVNFYEGGKADLPVALLAAFLRRLPKAKAAGVDWNPIFLHGRDKQLIELLVEARIVRSPDLLKIAKAHAADFYRSPSLDVLLDQGSSIPRSVWSELAAGVERGEGVLDATEALADSFALDRGADASAWLVEFLAEHGQVRQNVLRQLLRNPEDVFRLVRYLTTGALGSAGRKQKATQGAIRPVVLDLLQLCENAVVEGKRTASTGSLILGQLQLSASAARGLFDVDTQQQIRETSERVAQPIIVNALRAAELQGDDPRASAGSEPVVVSMKALHAAVQEYLRKLPRGTDGDLEPAERALRFERYIGRREVIQRLLPILDEADDAQHLKDRLDAELFNVGVRPLGLSDRDAIFDPHRHEPLDPRIVPGAPVTVAKTGWALGAGDDALVLSKARVNAR